MNNMLVAVWTVAMLGMVTSAMASPVNLSFETGDLSGWSVSNPLGISEFDGIVPAGSVQVVQNWPWGGAPGPVDGLSMAAVGTGNAWFLPGQGQFEIDIHQSFTLDGGMSISGSSFFFNGDYAEQDAAWVRILDASGNILAVPWLQYSGTANSTPYQSSSAWGNWQWVAPTAGNYTLALGVSTKGDNRFATFGIHDGIRVPEPSSLALLTVGVGVLLVRKTQGRRRKVD